MKLNIGLIGDRTKWVSQSNALSYLKTVCIEDKYPEGQSLLSLIQMDEKEFGKRKHTDEWREESDLLGG